MQGVVYSERGDFESALKFYNLAVEKNPTYVEALCNIGVIFKNSGQLTLAIEYYQRALKANPNFTIAANNLAIALTDRGTQVTSNRRLAKRMRASIRRVCHPVLGSFRVPVCLFLRATSCR